MKINLKTINSFHRNHFNSHSLLSTWFGHNQDTNHQLLITLFIYIYILNKIYDSKKIIKYKCVIYTRLSTNNKLRRWKNTSISAIKRLKYLFISSNGPSISTYYRRWNIITHNIHKTYYILNILSKTLKTLSD